MMTAAVALPSSYVQQLGELVDDLGADFSACLQVVGLQQSSLETPIFRCSLDVFVTLVSIRGLQAYHNFVVAQQHSISTDSVMVILF